MEVTYILLWIISSTYNPGKILFVFSHSAVQVIFYYFIFCISFRTPPTLKNEVISISRLSLCVFPSFVLCDWQTNPLLLSGRTLLGPNRVPWTPSTYLPNVTQKHCPHRGSTGVQSLNYSWGKWLSVQPLFLICH